MKYADEEFLKAKNMKEAQAENKTEEKAEEKTDEKEPVIYERRNFLEDMISMEVPADCAEVSEEAVNFVFYGANKPQYVIESESTNIAVGYNYTDMEIDNDDIFRFGSFASKMLETMGPGVKIYSIKNHKMNHFNLSVVEFTSKGLDGGIYNQMFYVSVDGKLMINFVIMSAKYAVKQKEIAEHIIESFEINKENLQSDDNEK